MPARSSVIGLFILCVASPSAFALPTRNMALGFGVGLPELVGVQGQGMVSSHWQVGLSFGVLPIFSQGIGKLVPFSLKSRALTVEDRDFSVKPELAGSLNSLVPFIRFYPGESNFYIELAYAMIRYTADVTLQVTRLAQPATGTQSVTFPLTGSLSVVQSLPTLSIGHHFHTELFFFNLSLGASVLSTISTGLSFANDLPSSTTGVDPNELVSKVQDQANTAAQEGLAQVRNEAPFIPSVQFLFGFLL